MPDDPRVGRLIEEMLDSGSSAEEACRDEPELLDQVLERLREVRALEARLGELFPEPGTAGGGGAALPDDLPRPPGYELVGVLGRGAVGVVYKALHLGLNRTVALKMLLAGSFATRVERRRLAREAELVAGLRHPNVVQVYDVGDLDGRPYFTMEFVEGGSLAEAIAGTPRPAREAAEVAAALADALAAAHRAGIVHRDLKPSNVLLSADGTPKVTDFGLARHLEAESSLTRTGAAVGTPSYMAPEQARGRAAEVGPASDLYALGAVLYELLTGRAPFRAESAAETIQQVLTQDPVPPARLNAKVPRDLETICLKCLRKDPRLRYADAEALAEDLRRFLRGEAISARPEGRLERLARRVRRRPASSAAAAAGTLLAATLVAGGLWLLSEQAATERAAGADLREMDRALERSAWPEARAALERAKGRLGERGGPARLRRRSERGTRDLALAARLDAIRLRRAGTVGGILDNRRLVGEYQSAFEGAGLGTIDEAPEGVARRVEASSITKALVAMLDDWALYELVDPRRRSWAVAVARLADRDGTGWRDRARDPATWRDRAKLEDLLAAAPVDDQSVPLLLALEGHWTAAGGDPVPFLERVQRAHPGDFWVNLRLGDALREGGRAAQAARYYQAAIALRPDAGIAHSGLGLALAGDGHHAEAVEPYRRALRLDPMSAPYHHNLAFSLLTLGRLDEALEHSGLAARLFPDVAMVHWVLGECLEAKGRHDEAVGRYREAVALDPKLVQAQRDLRAILIRRGRADEARAAWGKALEADPPGHDDWYGYAEFCLFLGDEEEYRRARRALLAKFGKSDAPIIAERTARACLLLPASAEELAGIVALGEHAWMADRQVYGGPFPHFLFLQGLAEYRLGHFDRAIALMRGEASRVLGPAPRLVLAMALHRDGRAAEARTTLEEAVAAHDWRASEARDQDGWIYHALRREAEALILPDPSSGPR